MATMKPLAGAAAAALLCVASGGAAAAERSFSLVAGYLTQAYSTEVNGFTFEADRFRGPAFGLTGAFHNNWGARLLYYATDHEDVDLENKGFELMALWGSNLRRQGFTAHLGLGFFRETWDFGPIELDASGWAVGVGIGYNWDRVSLALNATVRDGSDYEDFYQEFFGGGDWKVTPTSVGLNLGVRF